MMDRMAREMREITAKAAAGPQYIPIPMPPQQQAPQGAPPPSFPRFEPPPIPVEAPPEILEQPVVPPPPETTEGIPRFARDVVEEEEQIEPLVLEGMGGLEDGGLPPSAEPGLRKEGEQTSDAVEEKKDLRQRLRDFLKRIRERLDQRKTAEEESGTPAPVAAAIPPTKKVGKGKIKKDSRDSSAAPPAGSTNKAGGLVNYLEELTEYLPDQRKSSFRHSDARLKIEYIKSRLKGRSGIKNQIESRFTPPMDESVGGSTEESTSSSSMDLGKIAETFDFMKNLAAYHPDKTLGTMLQSKLSGILHKIRG
jgi:hypothetical protein